MTAVDTIERVEIQTTHIPAEASHIVLLPRHLRDKTTPQAYCTQAAFEGFAVQALCGHKWIPSKDPKKLPVCFKCLEIFQHDPYGHGDRDNLPEA